MTRGSHGRDGGLSAQRAQPPRGEGWRQRQTCTGKPAWSDANRLAELTLTSTPWNILRAPAPSRVTKGNARQDNTPDAHVTPRENGSQCNELAKPNAPARRRAPRLRCTPECRVCVVALVRGEMCVGTLARRTPPNWDGALDSALGKSFTTRPILSVIREEEEEESSLQVSR